MNYLKRAGFITAIIFLMFFIACGGSSGSGKPQDSRNTPPLTFTGSASYDIPESTVGIAIMAIDVSGGVKDGTPPYVFSSAGLPSGIGISGAGVISGTPESETAAGTATITVTDNAHATRSISINYGSVTASDDDPPSDSTLTFTGSSDYDIPESTIGIAITAIDVSGGVSGGTPPYVFDAADLPDGISISGSGVISGTPESETAAGTATITVTDSALDTRSISINYGSVTASDDDPPHDPALTFNDSASYDIPPSKVGMAIDAIDVSGGVSGGTPPYVFDAEDLPSGIGINSETGVISGTPDFEAEAGTATITVTDGDDAARSIEINYGAVTVPVFSDIPWDEAKELKDAGKIIIYIKSDGNVISFIDGDDLSDIFPDAVNSVAEAINALKNVKTLLGINDPEAEFTGKKLGNPFGFSYKLQQIYKNIPVYAREIIISTDKNGNVISLTNDYYQFIDEDFEITTGIDAAAAEEIALSAVKEEIEEEGYGSEDAKITSPGELVIYTLNSSPPVLAWRVSAGIFGINNDYFIDQSGKIIDVISNIRTASAVIRGIDLSGEEQEFTVNKTGDKYELFDPDRNIKIYNYREHEEDLPITRDTGDPFARAEVSAIANVSAVFDYYKNILERDSIDNDGMTVRAVIHYKENEDEHKGSFWNGSWMTFGDGEEYVRYLDVVAHEFTHGVVDHTAGFIYQGESGALHEAYADIFGELIEMEYMYDDDEQAWSHTWIHGENLEKPRNLEDPNDSGQPKNIAELMGDYTEVFLCRNPGRNNDYCGVHIRNGIINHAAYLMWDSKEFSKTELAQLWYYSLYLLTPSSEFSSVRYALTAGVRALVKAGALQSPDGQIEAINSAFNAVQVDTFEWDGKPIGFSGETGEDPGESDGFKLAPDLVGMFKDDAIDILKSEGFSVWIIAYVINNSDELDGKVISQYPNAGILHALDNPIYLTVSVKDQADNEPPSVPQNLTGLAISSTHIYITWDASTDNVGVAGYYVYRDGVNVLTALTTSFNNTFLTPSRKYCYEVSAIDVFGNESGKSAEFCTETLSDDGGPFIGGDVAMVLVPGGTFMMGCTAQQTVDCIATERPAHQVTLSNYYIGKYEVTQGQWKAVMGSGSNPSSFKGDNLPVENVSWDNVQEFIEKLNEKTGKNYRLPTEAEWEYAARGRNVGQEFKYSGSNSIDDVAWYNGNSENILYPDGTTHPVGTKAPNQLGIHDMSGNVYEFVSDYFGNYGTGQQINPQGPEKGMTRIARGGSWQAREWSARVSFRTDVPPSLFNSALGFRLASSTP